MGAAQYFVGQIGLHAVTYPKRYSIKVAFAILFMKDYAETWSQPPYLIKVFNGEVFSDFINDFKYSFYDLNRLCQSGLADPPPDWHCVGLYPGLQLSCPHRWLGQSPSHEPLLAQTQGEHPTFHGIEKH
ncbi:uncharacterized protein VP01_980g4 [Puccinia sorghi]|uniref:Uncharacterized protein n=1 Tax=Puccinia sorghi TaxID=27349 RepID=A0A0L6U7V3_9BASI|nr:uncharacterized protein VP01_980g4 [Puccinia sorghi]